MKKRTGSKRTVSVKAFVAILALVLALGCAAGGTFAWLIATTDTVTNTFTYGDINIELTEDHPADRNAKIIPGIDIEKDPKVTVLANSEACWLFVKVEKNGTFVTDKVKYSIANGWMQGDGTKIPANVYYREVGATGDTAESFYVLTGNEKYTNGVVTVSDTLTKEDIKTITGNSTLTFTAYAVQKDGIDDAATAWGKVSA